jgi:cytochrome c oxidase subunit 2
MKLAGLTASVVAILATAGCAGIQTSLGGQAVQSSNFVTLFTVFMIVCTIMFLLIVGAMLGAIVRRRRGAEALPADGEWSAGASPITRTALTVWGAVIAVGLTALAVASFFTDRSNAAAARNPKLAIAVTAHQWWWDVQYSPDEPSHIIRTANELHLPVGIPAEITLQSDDVIHSFWIPNLAGKQDVIPGRVTDAQILPRRIGQYRGQCAEFCGVQHANMALDVTVESMADFKKWAAAQLQPAPAPTTPLTLAGYNYVTTRQCSVCHNITGTPANGQVGPDLTHLASRKTIAAGALPLNTGNLYGWVADPQSQKPGSEMPTMQIEPQDLHAIVAYLETLK